MTSQLPFSVLAATLGEARVRARKDIPSLICGDIKYAEAVIDDNGIILLVQEDQRYFDSSDLSLNCLPKRSPYLLKTTRCGRGHTALI